MSIRLVDIGDGSEGWSKNSKFSCDCGYAWTSTEFLWDIITCPNCFYAAALVPRIQKISDLYKEMGYDGI